MSQDFVYSTAARCEYCAHRVLIPSRSDASRFEDKSEGRLRAIECPVSAGWHLYDTAVETVSY